MLLAEEVAAHHVQVGERVVVETPGQPFGEARRVAVGDVVVAVERRDAHADTAAAPYGTGGFDDLEEQARAVGEGAAVGAAALVDAIAQEFVEQIAVGTVDLDPVESGGLGVLGGAAEAGDDSRQLVIGQCARNDVRLLALRRMHFVVGDGQRARRHRLGPVVEQRVTGPATVPDLQENPAAGSVDRVGD